MCIHNLAIMIYVSPRQMKPCYLIRNNVNPAYDVSVSNLMNLQAHNS